MPNNMDAALREKLVEAYGEVPALPLPRSRKEEARLIAASAVYGDWLRTSSELEERLGDDIAHAAVNKINKRMCELLGVGASKIMVSSPGAEDVSPGTVLSDLLMDSGLWLRWIDADDLVYGFVYTASAYIELLYGEAVWSLLSDRYKDDVTWGERESLAWDLYRQTVVEGNLFSVFEHDRPWVAVYDESEGAECRRIVVFPNIDTMSRVPLDRLQECIAELPDGTREFDLRIEVFMDGLMHRLQAALAIADNM